MYPKASHQKRNSLKLPRRQGGFLIPLAIFIVVVMGLLAIALARTTTQTGLATAQELLSLQAFYAAESGAQHGMNVLFFPDASNRAAVNARCVSLNEAPSFGSAPGLAACSAQVTCVCADCAPTDATSYYTLTSIGSCGAGAISAQRTVRVGAFMDTDAEP